MAKCNSNKIASSYEIRIWSGMVIIVCILIVIDDIRSATIHTAQKLQNDETNLFT